MRSVLGVYTVGMRTYKVYVCTDCGVEISEDLFLESTHNAVLLFMEHETNKVLKVFPSVNLPHFRAMRRRKTNVRQRAGDTSVCSRIDRTHRESAFAYKKVAE
jgi:hypothetical protein